MSEPTSAVDSDRQVLITRVFDAPRERVFRAWTDPDELAAWYGPEQLDAPRERIHVDLRPGGRWELTMVRREDGAEFPIGYDVLEVVEPELLVLRSDPIPGMPAGEVTVVRVEFHDHGERTRMTLSDGPYPPEGRGRAEAGYGAAFDKLAARVAGR